MATLTAPVPPPSTADLGRLLAVPVAAGIALGVGDLVVMTHVAYPWAILANSSAVWAIAAFVLGAGLRVDPVRSAVAGVVMLLVAVEAYYGYAALTGMGQLSTLWSGTAQMWMVFAVFAGAIFGVAGSWVNSTVPWQHGLGSAAGAAVLLGEALHTLRNLGASLGGGFRSDLGDAAVSMAVLGVVVLVLTARRPAVLAIAVLAVLPLAVFSAAAFSAVGISY